MNDDTPLPFDLLAVACKKMAVAFDCGRHTSDGGVLLLAQIERRLVIVERLARCIEDPRDPACVDHTLAEMIRFRALLIAAGLSTATTVMHCATIRRSSWWWDGCRTAVETFAPNRP